MKINTKQLLKIVDRSILSRLTKAADSSSAAASAKASTTTKTTPEAGAEQEPVEISPKVKHLFNVILPDIKRRYGGKRWTEYNAINYFDESGNVKTNFWEGFPVVYSSDLRSGTAGHSSPGITIQRPGQAGEFVTQPHIHIAPNLKNDTGARDSVSAHELQHARTRDSYYIGDGKAKPNGDGTWTYVVEPERSGRSTKQDELLARALPLSDDDVKFVNANVIHERSPTMVERQLRHLSALWDNTHPEPSSQEYHEYIDSLSNDEVAKDFLNPVNGYDARMIDRLSSEAFKKHVGEHPKLYVPEKSDFAEVAISQTGGRGIMSLDEFMRSPVYLRNPAAFANTVRKVQRGRTLRFRPYDVLDKDYIDKSKEYWKKQDWWNKNRHKIIVTPDMIEAYREALHRNAKNEKSKRNYSFV